LICTATTISLMQPVPHSGPTGRLQDTSSHRKVSLVFFSKFEPISLSSDSYMQRNGIPMVYKRDDPQLPTKYVCPVENVLGQVPILPCYLKGNLHNTILYSLRYHVSAGAAADSRQDSGTSSRLFEINIWMWHYRRAFPRTISVQEVEKMRVRKVQGR
jgi:hypothetical protein